MNKEFSILEVPKPLTPISKFLAKVLFSAKKRLVSTPPKLTSLVNFIDASSHTFLLDNLGYATFFSVRGLGFDIKPETFDKIPYQFNQHLRPFLKVGHQVQLSFASYQDSVVDQIKSIQRGRKEFGDRFGLSARETDESLINHIKDHAFFEEQIICLITPYKSTILQREVDQIKDVFPDIPLSEEYESSLSQGRGNPLLVPHNLFVDAFKKFCTNNEVELDAVQLDHHEALATLLSFTDSKTAKTNMAQKLTPNFDVQRRYMRPDLELFDAFFAKDFDAALYNEPPRLHPTDDSVVQVGNRIYMSVVVESYSGAFNHYGALHTRLCEKSIPYMMKTSIGGDPIRELNIQYSASKLGSTLEQRAYNKNYSTILNYAYDEAPVFVQQTFTTWVDGAENTKLLRAKAEELLREIKNWSRRESNKAHIENISPRETFLSTMPCNVRSTAPKIPLPLIDSVNRLPFFQPSFPWKHDGDLVVTSPDGKIMPISMLKGRVAKVTYITGAMGTGKTALLCMLRNNLILHRDNSTFPFQINVDVDNSIKTDTELYAIESPDLADKVIHIPITNNGEDSNAPRINILDTPVGLRQLPSGVFKAIASALADRVLGPSGDEVPDALSMLEDLMRKAYKKCAQGGTAKKISLSSIPNLINTLKLLDFEFQQQEEDEHGISEDARYVGWDIVDFLMLHGEIEMAAKVQTLCVPILNDLLNEANSAEWQEINSLPHNQVPRGELLRNKLSRMIEQYPFIASPSTYSIWNKHIITFELGKVVDRSANSNSSYESRFWFNLVFIYVRALLGLSLEDVPIYEDAVRDAHKYRTKNADELTEAIVDFHKKRIQDVSTAMKRAVIDEFHRYLGDDHTGNGYAAQTVSSLINEIRRSGTELVFASPLPVHGNLFKEVATMYILLGFNNDHALKQCMDVFSLSEYEAMKYVKDLRLNPARGTNAYIIIKDVSEISSIKEFRHRVYIPIPSYNIWRYANRNIEKLIRYLVIEKFGVVNGLIILAGALPSAGSSKEIARLQLQMAQEGEFDVEQMTEEDKAKVDAKVAEQFVKKLSKPTEYEFHLLEGRRRVYL